MPRKAEVQEEVKEVQEEVQAEVQTEETNTEKPGVEYVDHAPLFRDGEKYKNPLNVIVNGVKYSVPRGVPLRLPKVVAEVIDQSIAQDAYAAELDRKMQEAQVTVF